MRHFGPMRPVCPERAPTRNRLLPTSQWECLRALSAALLACVGTACQHDLPAVVLLPVIPDTVSASEIRIENSHAGDHSWHGFPPASGGDAAAFLDVRSVPPGGSVAVFGIARDSQLLFHLYRVGWYAGAGARLILATGALTVPDSAPCSPPTPGPVICTWPAVTRINIPTDASPGVYIVRYVNKHGRGGLIPLVVRSPRPSAITVVLSFNTYQAYNTWGGDSFYQLDGATQSPHISFQRPYAGSTLERHFLSTDLPLVRFLERWDYPVGYLTDADFDADSAAGETSRAIIFSGHGEYWTVAMRDHAERLRDGGVGLAFFGANDAYWRVRYEGPMRDILVCYKHGGDPLVNDRQLGTHRFRDEPFRRPENELIGIMYNYGTNTVHGYAPLTALDTTAAFFAGTGFRELDQTTPIGGWEGDRAVSNAPSGLRVLFQSSFTPDNPAVANDVYQTTYYRARSGAVVFAAGTIGWNWALDDLQPRTTDPRLQLLVKNLLNEYLRPAQAASAAGAAR